MLHSLLFLIILAVPAGAFAASVPNVDYWTLYTVYLINLSRSEEGLPPIGLDNELRKMAQNHANDTARNFNDSTNSTRRSTYLEHVSSDGRQLEDRIQDYTFKGALGFGENVGFRWKRPFTDVSDVIQRSINTMHEHMMAELPPHDGHRKTILGDYTHVGVGLELHRTAGESTNTLFYVTDFGKLPGGNKIVVPELSSPVSTVEKTSNAVNEQQNAQQKTIEKIETVKKRPRTNAWLERNLARVQKRKSERLERMLNNAEERKRKRMERRGFLQ